MQFEIPSDAGRLSEDEIERMVREAEEFAAEDAALRRGERPRPSDLYAVLAVSEHATSEEIKAAYRRAVTAGDFDEDLVEEAFATLFNAESRAEYDARRARDRDGHHDRVHEHDEL